MITGHDRDRQATTRELSILNDLAYIMECLILDYTGEARGEIGLLADKLARIKDPAEAEKYREASLQLEEVRATLSGSGIERAKPILSRISRQLWNKTVPLTRIDE